MGLGAAFTALTEFKFIALKWQKVVSAGKGRLLLRGPEMSPAFFGVGYIIGPKLARSTSAAASWPGACSRRSWPISCTRTTPPP